MFLPESFRFLLPSLLPKITGNITKFSTYDGIVKLRLTESISGLSDYDLIRLVRSKLVDENISKLIYSGDCGGERNYFIIHNFDTAKFSTYSGNVKLRLTESISGLSDYDLIRLVRSKLGDENISKLIYSGKCDDERNYFITYNPNRAKWLKKVTQDGRVLEDISGDVIGGSNDKGVILAAVTQHGDTLQYASLALRSDKEVVLAAVTQNGLALRHASDNVTGGKNDKEVVLVAVTQNGYALQYASDKLKNDKEVVLAAVTQHGWALQYASPVLRDNKEVVLAAITQHGWALQYASVELRADKDVLAKC